MLRDGERARNELMTFLFLPMKNSIGLYNAITFNCICLTYLSTISRFTGILRNDYVRVILIARALAPLPETCFGRYLAVKSARTTANYCRLLPNLHKRLRLSEFDQFTA